MKRNARIEPQSDWCMFNICMHRKMVLEQLCELKYNTFDHLHTKVDRVFLADKILSLHLSGEGQ